MGYLYLLLLWDGLFEKEGAGQHSTAQHSWVSRIQTRGRACVWMVKGNEVRGKVWRSECNWKGKRKSGVGLLEFVGSHHLQMWALR